MLKNNKGVTLFELLATISVSGIVLALLTSILFTTLFTKNQVDYNNRLDDEIYDISSFLSGRFSNIGYGSIKYYPTADENMHVFIVTREFDPVIRSGGDGLELSRDGYVSKILLFMSDVDNPENSGIYFDTLFEVDPSLDVDSQIMQYVNFLDAYVSAFLVQPRGKISSDNLIVESVTLDTFDCVKEYDTRSSGILNTSFDLPGNSFVSVCSNSFMSIDLIVSYQLRSGEPLDPRSYTITLYF